MVLSNLQIIALVEVALKSLQIYWVHLYIDLGVCLLAALNSMFLG